MLKRTLIIAAIAAALPTLASAQSSSNRIGLTVNPQDSGYHEVITENPYKGKAVASGAASSATMPVAVNPQDSGYHEVITENPYTGKPAGSRSSLTSKFRPVVNPEDSGYLGGWNSAP
ncbi:MAG: hypothetical protein HY661_12960 [Betaproteobacteria bacterium]|nr:hypothetical protein [Betaproteobacteria bacterium]